MQKKHSNSKSEQLAVQCWWYSGKPNSYLPKSQQPFMIKNLTKEIENFNLTEHLQKAYH